MTTFHQFRNQNGGMWCTASVDRNGTEAECGWVANARVHQDPAVVQQALAPKAGQSVAERLRTAAERLSELDRNAAQPPWLASRDSDGRELFIVDGMAGEVRYVVAKVSGRANAELIVALRPLAPVIAKQLQSAADRFTTETTTNPDGFVLHDIDGCGWGVEGEDPTCECFDADLALAAAILGKAS